MTRHALFLTALLTAGLLGGMPRGTARADGVLSHFAWTPVDYTVGKVIDEFVVEPLLEKIGWKPSVSKMAKRLAELEKNAALKSEQREAIRKLREQISKCASREELKRVVTEFKSNLRVINRRLNTLEDGHELHEVEIADLKNKTSYGKYPEHFIARGEQQLKDKEHFRALANARVASKLNPALPEPYLLQAKVYAAMKATELANACYDQAIKVAPRHVPSYRARAEARMTLYSYAGASADYTQAVRLDPKDGYSWGRRAQALLALRRYAEATDSCSRALTINPGDTFARFQRGRAYVLDGKPTKAVADFDVYVRTLPKDPDGYDRRGFAHLKNGALDKALGDLQQALKLAPDHAFAHNHLTHLWNAKRNYYMAAQVGKRAVELSPRNVYPHFEYAVALQRVRKVNEALKYYKKAASLNPFNVENYTVRAYAECGLIYSSRNDHYNAVSYLSKALALAPGYQTSNAIPLLTYRARAYNSQREYAKAIADATAALKINSRDPNTYFARALARGERSDESGAIADYTEGLRLYPHSAWAYNNRGVSYRLRGDNRKALADYTEAIRLDPKHDFAYRNRGVVYRSLGKYDDAARDFVKALKSSSSGMREDAIANLIDIRPSNPDLLKALPAGANAYGSYSGLRKRLYVPGDKSSYGAYKNYGSSSTSSYRGYKGLPSGYWVYVAPYWYIWGSK